MEVELDEKLKKEVRKNYAAIILKLIGLFFFCLILILLLIYLMPIFTLELGYEIITFIAIIPILIVTTYLGLKESKKPYVPIEYFLLKNEEIIYTESTGRLNDDRVGSGFCYLTNKRFIYLPTNYARTNKGAAPLFLPLRNIKSISRSNHLGFNEIRTRNQKYFLSFHDIEEWKSHLKKFLYIRISDF